MTGQGIEIQGHRGARGLLPENTIPAFERAVELGVDVLELDLGMTRDGVPVVHHDRALTPDRTRDASGAWLVPPGPLLRTLSLAELTTFDVGRAAPDGRTRERFPEQVPRDDTRIPTLAEVLALGRRAGAEGLRFNIETKLNPLAPEETAGPEEFARAVVAVLRTEGMIGRADLQSFDWRVLLEARRIAPELATVCLTVERRWHDNILRGQSGPIALDSGARHRGVRRLGPAPRRGGGMRGVVSVLSRRDRIGARRGARARAPGGGLDRERGRGHARPRPPRGRRCHHRLPGPRRRRSSPPGAPPASPSRHGRAPVRVRPRRPTPRVRCPFGPDTASRHPIESVAAGPCYRHLPPHPSTRYRSPE